MKFIPYYRVSTQKQGNSGLGLEAQKFIVENYIKRIDGSIVSDDFVEVVSGTNKERISAFKSMSLDTLLSKRPTLLAAINEAKAKDAILITKDLSRLSRFTLLIDYMISTNIKFVCAEYPNDNEMMLKFRAAIYEDEARNISKRTSAALQAKKARGQKVGNPQNFTNEGRLKAWESIRAKAKLNANNKRASAIICEYKAKGMSLKAIAEKLNEMGFKTSTNKAFHKTTVSRIYKRYCLS